MRNQRAAVTAAALVLAATVIAGFLLLGSGGDESGEATATAVAPTSTRAASPRPPRNPGWQVIDDPAAGLRYEVPPDWSLAPDTESLESSSGVELGHLADFGVYLCQGAEYGRAFSGSGVVPGAVDPAEAAAELAAAIAADQYSDGSQTARVTLSRATPLVRDGARGALVRAEAEATADDVADRCASTKGEITVVALATEAGAAVVVLGADVEPGADSAAPTVAVEQLRAVTDSVRLRR
ncbi:hypothetical protein [Actinokineospora iranica]|uniref:hypothetical protein n=1 Tax=Actinokineospora iranica TaxID=1271860 RepID=UPI001114242F|nr:hypothetical protein [Actinokineospora iranica]